MLVPSIGNFVGDVGSSKNMNVDGTTPKTFTFSPGSGNSLLLSSLVLLMEDAGSSTLNNFGSISALTNGLLIELSLGGVIHQLTNIKDNSDLCTRFKRNHFGNSAVSTLLVPAGFGESVDIFVGELELPNPIGMAGDDFVRVTVRDNLSNVNVLAMSYLVLKEVV